VAGSRPRLSRGEVGAWVLKGNPAVWDYRAALAAVDRRPGVVTAHAWTVGVTHRARLIEPGDPMVVWITGPDEPGIYEIGLATGRVGTCRVGTGSTDGAQGATSDVVPIASVLLSAHVPRDDLRADPVLRGAEQFRIPLIRNPTYLTPEQRDALTEHLEQSELRTAGWL